MLAALIRAALHKQGLSQRALAAASAVSSGAISMILNGTQYNISPRIANLALDLSAQQILQAALADVRAAAAAPGAPQKEAPGAEVTA